jgi:hypothetical protein
VPGLHRPSDQQSLKKIYNIPAGAHDFIIAKIYLTKSFLAQKKTKQRKREKTHIDFFGVRIFVVGEKLYRLSYNYSPIKKKKKKTWRERGKKRKKITPLTFWLTFWLAS